MRRWMPACLALLLAGCATTAPVPPEQVAVHESVTSAPVNYKVIERIWVDTWPSAFVVPTYASREEATQAMRQKAAELGGNGVLNFGCYRRHGDDSLSCNGTVVRFE
jgi:uncharacterized protein YbjQ (UPF0145 family)